MSTTGLIDHARAERQNIIQATDTQLERVLAQVAFERARADVLEMAGRFASNLSYMTKTAQQFIQGVTRGLWSDCPEPWDNTATMGLSDFDREIVDGLAKRNEEDPELAEQEIVQAAKDHARL